MFTVPSVQDHIRNLQCFMQLQEHRRTLCLFSECLFLGKGPGDHGRSYYCSMIEILGESWSCYREIGGLSERLGESPAFGSGN